MDDDRSRLIIERNRARLRWMLTPDASHSPPRPGHRDPDDPDDPDEPDEPDEPDQLDANDWKW